MKLLLLRNIRIVWKKFSRRTLPNFPLCAHRRQFSKLCLGIGRMLNSQVIKRFGSNFNGQTLIIKAYKTILSSSIVQHILSDSMFGRDVSPTTCTSCWTIFKWKRQTENASIPKNLSQGQTSDKRLFAATLQVAWQMLNTVQWANSVGAARTATLAPVPSDKDYWKYYWKY